MRCCSANVKMDYGPYTVVEDGPNTPAGYYDLLIAQFQFAGLDYEVVADNLTEEEFVKNHFLHAPRLKTVESRPTAGFYGDHRGAACKQRISGPLQKGAVQGDFPCTAFSLYIGSNLIAPAAAARAAR